MKFFTNLGITVAAMFAVAVLLLIGPTMWFMFGYLGGIVLGWLFGGYVADGLNTVFGTERFTSNIIPFVTGTFAVIGMYFKSNQTNNNQ